MKYTLITGASSGIGYELAKICASNNHNLVLIARSTDKLTELKLQLEHQFPIQIYLITKNLALSSAATEIYDELQSQHIQVDILANNAGFGNYGLFQNTDWQIENQMIHLNILTLTHLTNLFLPHMLENKSGKILNVASIAAFLPGPYMAIYYATKAFVLSLSEALSEELHGTGITVTCLCPGPTASGFQKAANAENTKLFKNRTMPSSQKIAQFAYTELMKGTRVAVYGYINKITTITLGLLPRNLKTKLVKLIQE